MNIEIWLWLLLVMLPHNSRTAELLKIYGSALEAAKAVRDGGCTFLTAQEKQRAERTRTREVLALMNECDRLGIRIITLDDSEYPPALKATADPPIVLFVKGSLKPLATMPSVAVVGPRTPSEYGRNATDILCTQLAKNRIALISGLAVGIDSVVHRCAVNNGGYTVGVLACGLMVNYPTENEELKQRIVEAGGAVISELLPYTSVSAGYFKYRNRIISGLGQGTLIPEASVKSGALLTAEHCIKQGRPVLTLPPHDIFDERFTGVFGLIRGGAIQVFSVQDIYKGISSDFPEQTEALKLLNDARQHAPSNAKRKAPPKSEPSPSTEQEQNITSTQPADPAMASETSAKVINLPDPSTVSPEEYSVMLQLSEGPTTMDTLIEKTEITHDKMCAIVLGLELSDLITRNQDGTFSLA